jgi:endonuclease/exonuclease/phosphatase family metal-dependent hydrolase
VILFANTHFDHKGELARAESAKLLKARLEKLAEGVPVIVVGDFNATQDQSPYATLVKEGGLTDSHRAIHPKSKPDQEGTFHGFKGGTAGRRIDWILHSRDFETAACEVVHDNDAGRYPSDHYPVSAVLRWAKPNRP